MDVDVLLNNGRDPDAALAAGGVDDGSSGTVEVGVEGLLSDAESGWDNGSDTPVDSRSGAGARVGHSHHHGRSHRFNATSNATGGSADGEDGGAEDGDDYGEALRARSRSAYHSCAAGTPLTLATHVPRDRRCRPLCTPHVPLSPEALNVELKACGPMSRPSCAVNKTDKPKGLNPSLVYPPALADANMLFVHRGNHRTLLTGRNQLLPRMVRALPSSSAAITRPHNFRSCAVVGNSGALRFGEMGLAIDSHDVVLRLNQAPTLSYGKGGSRLCTSNFWAVCTWGGKGGSEGADSSCGIIPDQVLCSVQPST